MRSIRLLLFGLWMMVIDAETVTTPKAPKPPVTATPSTKIAATPQTDATNTTTTIAPTTTTNTTTIAPAITTNTTTIAPAITTNTTTTIAPTTTTNSAIEDCSECDIRVRETCMAMKDGQRECPSKIGVLGRHYRCKQGARQGGKLCKVRCHHCAYGTDYCDEKGECVTQDKEMIKSMRRCMQGYGGPDCSMPCDATCHNQCSWMESYNATTKKLACDHELFVCQEENKQFFYGDEQCKETCRQSNDPLKECQGLCLYMNEAKSYQCIDLWNTTKTNKIPNCPLSKYGEKCEKACDKCGPDAVCNKETGDCQCRHDVVKCMLCPPERESEKSCSKECKIEFDWNISTKEVAGPEGYCEDGKILCQYGVKTDGCRRCTKGWTGDHCDQPFTEPTTTSSTTMTTTTTEYVETVSGEDDVEQTTAVLNAPPKPGDRRPYELPPCNDTWSLVRREPSFCVQKERCANKTDTTNSSCVAHLRNCTEIEYELFYCIRENNTALAPKIEKESNAAWIVAAVILSIFEVALCCFISIGGAVYTGMWIAAKRRMSEKKKNEKKPETPDGNSSMISNIGDEALVSVTGLTTSQDPSRITALGLSRNDVEEKRPLLNKTSF